MIQSKPYNTRTSEPKSINLRHVKTNLKGSRIIRSLFLCEQKRKRYIYILLFPYTCGGSISQHLDCNLPSSLLQTPYRTFYWIIVYVPSQREASFPLNNSMLIISQDPPRFFIHFFYYIFFRSLLLPHLLGNLPFGDISFEDNKQEKH